MKFLNPKKTNLFWFYIVSGVLLLILSALLMPVWKSLPDWAFWKSWGTNSINILICLCILLYLFGFLLKKITKNTNSVVKILTIIEFVILTIIAIGCVLQQFKIINVGGACSILGLAIWCRGAVEIFRAYYHTGGNNKNYPIWWLVIAIIFVTFGTYLFVKPLFTDLYLLWFFIVLIMIFAILLIVIGVLAKPNKIKSKK